MAMGAPVPIPRWDELTNEAFGGAGYKNGFERFFQMPPPPQQGPAGTNPAGPGGRGKGPGRRPGEATGLADQGREIAV
jgi:hypothetical protein